MAEDVVMTYWAKLGLDVSEFFGGITDAQKGFLAFTAGATATLYTAKTVMDEYTRYIQKMGTAAKGILDLSYATGVSTDEIQQFHYAATLAGENIDMVDALLNKLTLSMGQFEEKTSGAAKGFEKLKIDPSGKSTPQVFLEVAKALDAIPNPADRASISIDLLGRNYRDSLPFMKDYIDNLDKIEKFKGFSPEVLENQAKYKEGLDEMGVAWENFWGTVLFSNGPGSGMAGQKTSPEMIQYFRNKGWTEEQISAMLAKEVGAALQNAPLGPEDFDWSKSGTKRGFVDSYAGLDDAHVRIKLLNADIQKNKELFNAATNQVDADTYSAAIRKDELELERLNAELLQTKTLSSTAFSRWAGSPVVGNQGTAMDEFMNKQNAAGASYQQALNAWANSDANRSAGGAGVDWNAGTNFGVTLREALPVWMSHDINKLTALYEKGTGQKISTNSPSVSVVVQQTINTKNPVAAGNQSANQISRVIGNQLSSAGLI